MRNPSHSIATFIPSCVLLLAFLQLPACGTGNNATCDGKSTTRCGTGGVPNAGGSDSGGYRSTSTTVLKAEGSLLLDLSKPLPAGAEPSGADAGDLDGAPVILRGVNRSGTEYKCVQGSEIFDGPDTEESVRAIASWKANAVRVPLNESCWLSASPYTTGEIYKKAIQRYVDLLHKYDIYPILELHWVAPGTDVARGQLPMPDLDHAVDFWKDVTTTFKDDLGVIFELYNEPYPGNNRDNDAAWQCWRDGCDADIYANVSVNGTLTWQRVGSYKAVGLQQLVTAVRETEGLNSAANHLILLGGVQYSNSLTQWNTYKPIDPANNLGAAWHIYNFNGCASTTCFDDVPATLAGNTVVVATEFGQNNCQGDIVEGWMQWFDTHRIGYLGWTWDVYGSCVATNNPWPLISDYSGSPLAGLGQAVHDHFLAVAAP